MGINLNKIEQILALITGSLKGNQKKALLDALQYDTELADYYVMLKQLHTVTPQKSAPIVSATRKLSQSLYKDFMKKQSLSNISYGVQIFDSSLLPLPEGVRPASVDTRHLKYLVSDYVIELSIYPITVDSVELIGQVKLDDQKQKISITAKSKNSDQTVEIDEFGLFRIDRIEVGVCRLSFTFETANEGLIELKL